MYKTESIICRVLHITKKKSPLKHAYYLYGSKLSESDVHPYLGVQISNTLSWNEHIDYISRKGSSSLNLLRRNLYNRSPEVKPRAYLSLVRPILCYASSVWDPKCYVVKQRSVTIITESGLNPQIPDSIINLGNNYRSYRLDRPTPGGGVLAYVSSYLPTTCLTELEENGKEVIWLLLKPPRTPRPYSDSCCWCILPPGKKLKNMKERC